MILNFKISIDIFDQSTLDRTVGPTMIIFEGSDKVQRWAEEVEKQEFYSGGLEL